MRRCLSQERASQLFAICYQASALSIHGGSHGYVWESRAGRGADLDCAGPKSLDKMIKEGRIAVPPGGTLEKGSLYSMFIRMLLHNAMEEQKRQEALEMNDEDDDE